MTIIDRVALAKQGDNALSSIRPSICLYGIGLADCSNNSRNHNSVAIMMMVAIMLIVFFF